MFQMERGGAAEVKQKFVDFLQAPKVNKYKEL